MNDRSALTIAALTLAPALALAEPAESVIAPDIEKGEREFELAYGLSNDGGAHSSGLAFSFGAGVTDRWATEVGIEFEGRSGEGLEVDGFEWENRLGLIVDEDEPVALALLVSFERPRERDEGWSATFGLLSETSIGRYLLNANLLVERFWGQDEGDEGEGEGDEEEAKRGTALAYQWQWMYRHSHRIYYGLHGMGELGQWDDWAKSEAQEHQAGPAIFGRVKLPDRRRLNYELGFLFGLTEATSDYTLHMKLEYEL
ncbi:MAG: hypothetical protein KDH15_05875 [Rhodocyclaceae bacterium]|nr:hypothetical protein [Rhodocyclaceae bacterium]